MEQAVLSKKPLDLNEDSDRRSDFDKLIKRIVKLFISLVVFISDSLLRNIRGMFGDRGSRDFVVLYYHLVDSEERSRFCWQMDYLAKKTRLVPADFKGTVQAGVNSVAVTFDDAFASLAETAIPEMESRGIPFTVFVPTAFVGRPAGWIRHPGKNKSVPQVMDTRQIQALERIPAALIGSHCRTHCRLSELQDVESREEITRSKKELEEILEREVTLLSFPYGSHGENNLLMAREAGYQRVFTIEPKRNRGPVGRIFSAGRIRVDPGDWKVEFRLKVAGSYSWVTIASRMKKEIFRGVGTQH